jgi:hypothetical protein
MVPLLAFTELVLDSGKISFVMMVLFVLLVSLRKSVLDGLTAKTLKLVLLDMLSEDTFMMLPEDMFMNPDVSLSTSNELFIVVSLSRRDDAFPVALAVRVAVVVVKVLVVLTGVMLVALVA